jgi:hypothetical protein
VPHCWVEGRAHGRFQFSGRPLRIETLCCSLTPCLQIASARRRSARSSRRRRRCRMPQRDERLRGGRFCDGRFGVGVGPVAAAGVSSVVAGVAGSNLGSWMHVVAASWLMTSLTTSAALVALSQTANSAPSSLLALPAGALADVLDRRRLVIVTQALAVCCRGSSEPADAWPADDPGGAIGDDGRVGCRSCSRIASL